MDDLSVETALSYYALEAELLLETTQANLLRWSIGRGVVNNLPRIISMLFAIVYIWSNNYMLQLDLDGTSRS